MNAEDVVTGSAEEIKRESARRTRRSFLVGGAAAAAGVGAAYWINTSKPVGRLQEDLRAVLNTNAAVSRAVFDERGLAPTYAVEHARPLRLNGTVGLEQKLIPESWRLQFVGAANAASSPLYVNDVTAWEYKYEAKEQGPSALAPDFKTNPSKTPAAGLTLAERFEKMAQETSHKRRQGDAEAGPSASTPDIGTPGLLLTMDDLMKLPKVHRGMEFNHAVGGSEAAGSAGDVSASEGERTGAPVCVHGDAGRELLRRL